MSANVVQAPSFREFIYSRLDELADETIGLLWNRFPHYEEIFSDEGKRECRKDLSYHYLYLTDAVDAESETLFLQYVQWVKELFASISVPNEPFLESLKAMREVLDLKCRHEDCNAEKKDTAKRYIDDSLEAFSDLPEKTRSFITEENPLADTAHTYLDALLKRERRKAMDLIVGEAERGTDIRDIYEHVFQVSQWEIGRLWQENQISVAEEHYCTAATQLVMSRLYPYIFSRKGNGLVFVGTSVGDELHELGIRMITDFFELDGWDTYFLGANMPADSVVDTVAEEKAHVVGISVTITYHLHKARSIIEGIRAREDLKGVKILVGGYPFNKDPELWKKVGADGWAENARQAIKTAGKIVGA